MTSDPRIARLRRSLADGELVSDREFDALYPPRVRALSSVFWTPARVALRAAALLAPTPGTRVLDVGSGVGKLCIVAAASTNATVTGIEHRERLVSVARTAAERLGVSARFIHGDLCDVNWRRFDAFYFYNPFYENVDCMGACIDAAVELSQRRFLIDVQLALEALAHAPCGTRVVTYHGLGAELPPVYRLESSECAGSDALKLWIKTERPAADERSREVLAFAHPEGAIATI